MTAMPAIAVLGGGAWGTALALTLLRAGHRPTLYARDPDCARVISGGENPRYLPGIRFETGIGASADLASALAGRPIVLSAVPAQSLRQALNEAEAHIDADATLVICAKGIEHATGSLLSSVVGETLPGRMVAALSGPSFASDVALGLPTAVTIAARDHALALRLSALFTSSSFRCYSSDDLTGVEIGGALKNVLAIAAGAIAGAGLGASAQAAMVTRGFVELRRVGAALGARPETLMGLSGLGDLMLTCASAQSRNFAYGAALGRGDPLAGLPLAEGVATAQVAARICEERDISAPIMQAVVRLLQREITIGEAVESLMSRPLKPEHE